LQSFPASPEENSAAKESPRNFHVLKEFGLRKKTIFYLCEWEKDNISWTSLELERIRGGGGKQFFKVWPLFVQNVDLSSRSTFYSAFFYLCGRTIGQLATLEIL
jgi:hypothetical protein